MGLKGFFECLDRRIEVELPEACLVTQAADAAGIMLNISCAEAGTCGGCAVDLLEGTFQQRDGKIELDAGAAPRRVLGCQTRILSGAWRIRVPLRSLVQAGEKIVVDFDLEARFAHRPAARKIAVKMPPPTLEDAVGDFERIGRELRKIDGLAQVHSSLPVLRALPHVMTAGGFHVTVTLARRDEQWEVIRVEPGDTTGRLYGAAVDLGTTTVVCALVDLNTGHMLDTASCFNQQTQRCEDVASRIVHAEKPDGLRELQHLAVDESINKLIRLLCVQNDVAPEEIARMVVSGNTVMAHLLLGVSPKNIGVSPFQPSTKFPGTFPAGQIGLLMNPAGFVDVAPSIGAYVGGDIVGGLYVCGVREARRPEMLIDIGTNGEIALGTPEGMWACATAAGPAYEGSGITCGMRARSGAIERIRIDPRDLSVDYQVIGDAAGNPVRPVGVCGSGLIDVLAEAFRAGLIDRNGRIEKDLLGRNPRVRQVEFRGHPMAAFVIVPREETDDGVDDIIITEKDIEALLQTKGVIYVGARLLVKRAGLREEDIGRIWLAGGFARHIDVASAITIGMLPDLPVERFDAVGNTSLAGAYAALVDGQVWPEFDRIAAEPRVVELNQDPQFEDEYTCAMFLPNLMEERFPSLANLLHRLT